MTRPKHMAGLALALALITTQASAHAGSAAHAGFGSGFLHPFLGIDHMIAMLAVGLWAARLGGAAIWVLPLVFPLVMALGAGLALAGVALPAVETGIALSGVVLGVIVAFALRAPVSVAASIVGGFAVFHGLAHGAEAPGGISLHGYVAGFLLGTGLLHLAGISLAWALRGGFGARALQGTGVGIALLGGAALLGVA